MKNVLNTFSYAGRPHTSWGTRAMRRATIRTMVFALVACGLAGCQSGPNWASRLAWWKRDAPPEDSSLVARSAAPQLPSAQVTPPQVSPSAVPPSAANLAAANTPAVAAATAALPSTAASAPVASYPAVPNPTASAAAPAACPTANSAAAANPASLPASASMMPTTPGAPPATVAAQTGPYDPNAYRPSTTLPTVAATMPMAASDDNRYANGGSEPDRYAVTASAAAASAPAADRYDSSVPGRYDYPGTSTSQAVAATPPTPPAVSSSVGDDDRYGVAAAPVAAQSQQPAVAATVPPAGVPVAQYPTPAATGNATSAVAATVQLSTPPGQYRPGGTLSYPIQSTGGQVEVASRPATPVQ
jgi:ribonuclease E